MHLTWFDFILKKRYISTTTWVHPYKYSSEESSMFHLISLLQSIWSTYGCTMKRWRTSKSTLNRKFFLRDHQPSVVFLPTWIREIYQSSSTLPLYLVSSCFIPGKRWLIFCLKLFFFFLPTHFIPCQQEGCTWRVGRLKHQKFRYFHLWPLLLLFHWWFHICLIIYSKKFIIIELTSVFWSKLFVFRS